MLDKIGIDWRLLSFQMVNFILLLVILRKVLYKPILLMLENRRKRIEEGLDKAEKFDEEWRRIKYIQESKLAEAEEAAVKVIEKARLDAEKKGKEIIATVQQKSQKAMEEAQKNLQLEKEKIAQELKQETADHIVLATEKILKKTLSSRDHKELIQETLAAIKKNEA